MGLSHPPQGWGILHIRGGNHWKQYLALYQWKFLLLAQLPPWLRPSLLVMWPIHMHNALRVLVISCYFYMWKLRTELDAMLNMNLTNFYTSHRSILADLAMVWHHHHYFSNLPLRHLGQHVWFSPFLSLAEICVVSLRDSLLSIDLNPDLLVFNVTLW